MATPLDAQKESKGPVQTSANNVPISGKDAEIAVRMAIKMLNEGNGLQVIKDAIDKSQDPALVIGQFLAQMMGALGEQLAQKIGLDPRVFLAQGGFLEKILDYIEVKLGYPEDFSNEIHTQVLETIKAAAQSPQAAQPGAPQPGAPAQGGPPLDGGMPSV